jgi:hypothetical protein
MGERGWARVLLSWRWAGSLLTAEISAARYFIRCDRHEAVAWAELCDVDGRRRAEVGSFRSVAEARAACERDAVARCRREREERGPVSVAISPGHRRRANQGLRSRDPVVERDALDAALAAFAGVVEEAG